MNNFNITFWGVRGTIPTPDAANLQVGGHTSCVEMRCGNSRLIFDAGTGLYPLGEDETLNDMDIFLSHTHIDHILGFPFFSPLFRNNTTIRLWAGHLVENGYCLRDVMERLISPPIFPLSLDDFKADIQFKDFTAGDPIGAEHLSQAGIELHTMPLNHPDGATGYRVRYEGKSACYITDIEHLRDGIDQVIINFIQDTDLLIYDCTFDDRDFERFIGWGHSTWQEAARLSSAANVKQMAVFHHDPNRSDAALKAVLNELNQQRPNDIIAKQGLTITL